MSERERSRIEVKIFVRQDNSMYARIELESDVRPTGISFKELDFNDQMTFEGFAETVRIAGGALAEYQNKYYRDRHQPHECATTAHQLFIEIFGELENKDKTKAPKFVVERPFGYEDGEGEANDGPRIITP